MNRLLKDRRFWYVHYAIQIALTLTYFVFAVRYYTQLEVRLAVNVILNGAAMVLAMVVLQSMIRGNQERPEDIHLRVLIEEGVLFLLVDGAFFLIDGIPGMWVLNEIVNILYCILPIVMSWQFWKFVTAWGESAQYPRSSFFTKAFGPLSRLADAAAVGGTLYVLGNQAGGYLFTVSSKTGIYKRGPHIASLVLFSSLILLACVICLFATKMPLSEKLILLAYPLLPYLNNLVTMGETGPAYLAFMLFCSLMFFYSNLYVKRKEELESEHSRFMEERRKRHVQQEKLAISEKELMESRVNGMLLQISPHFIYNTLGTIDSLCDEDAAQAQQLIRKFSRYLKNNYQDLTREPMIPFQEELEHLKLYLSIEQVRFPNLNIRYEIDAEDFRIPSQSIQPLVENAVRHGTGKRRRGAGTITIRSKEEPDAWIIDIEDDGAGFAQEVDTDAAGLQIPDDSRRHIGISNVSKRISMLCAGTVHIRSIPGEGTVCTIRIPRDTMEAEES